MPDVKLTAIDSNALPWEERPNQKIGRSAQDVTVVFITNKRFEIHYQ